MRTRPREIDNSAANVFELGVIVHVIAGVTSNQIHQWCVSPRRIV